MIDFKRLTAVILAVLMLCSVAVIGVSADDGDEPHEAGWYVVGDANFFGVSWDSDIPQAKYKMTMEKGVYNVTVTDAPAGTFTFKVVETTSIGAISAWHPDGMGNDSSFTVTEAGSTVRFCLVPQERVSDDKPYAEVFAPGAEIPEITEPTTAPKPTPPPETVPEGKVKVNVKSNIGAKISETYNTSLDQTVSIDFLVNCPNPFSNVQGFVKYDSSILELQSLTMADQFESAVVNTNLNNMATFNSTNDENSYDFLTNNVLATAEFKFVSTGVTTVELNIEELNGMDQEYNLYGIITDGAVVDSATIPVEGAVVINTPTPETQATDPSSETKPAAKTTVKPTAAKSIYVGKTTTVKPNVKNGKGTTTFSTSNKKVATVSSKGVVKGVKKGTVIITVKNNGVKGKVTIKVVQRKNTMKVKTKNVKVKVKAKKTTFKKAKVFVVSKAKGTVTFKKTKGDKKITVSKAGKVTVKKGLKKGKTYTVKIKVTAKGTTAYKSMSKVVSFKVKVVK